MKKYRVELIYNDTNETGVGNCTHYYKEVSENTFNEIYKLICKD